MSFTWKRIGIPHCNRSMRRESMYPSPLSTDELGIGLGFGTQKKINIKKPRKTSRERERKLFYKKRVFFIAMDHDTNRKLVRASVWETCNRQSSDMIQTILCHPSEIRTTTRGKNNHKYIHYRVSLQSDLPLKLRLEFRPQFFNIYFSQEKKKKRRERVVIAHTHTTWQSRNNKKKLDSPIMAGLDDKPEFY